MAQVLWVPTYVMLGCETYCDARPGLFSGAATADKEAALRRATVLIDAYRSRFPGSDASIAIRRLNGREPALC